MTREQPNLSGQNPLPQIAYMLGELMSGQEAARELLEHVTSAHEKRIVALEQAQQTPDRRIHLDEGEVMFVRVFRRAFLALGGVGTLAGGSYGAFILTHAH